MKKILLIGMLAVSGLSYGRDNERREAQELKVLEAARHEDGAMISRERRVSRGNMETYREFHRELAAMDRGHSDK